MACPLAAPHHALLSLLPQQMFSPLLPPVAQFRNLPFHIRVSSFLTLIVSLNSLSQDPTKGLVPKRHNVKEKGDGCEENVEDTDNDSDEEEEDPDEDDEEEKDEWDEEEEEDEERDTSTEGRPSSQDHCSERPSEKTSNHVSLTLFKNICCKFLPPGGADVEQCDLPKRQRSRRKRQMESSWMSKVSVN